MELKWVLQQLHRHRHENWKVSLDPEKAKSEKKRKGTNEERDEFKNNCKLLMNEGEFHSNEVSESDDELVQKEVDINI
ncbi:8236_t:CDS:2 [Funneliformis caledonium]|uniref:8236_t:CDS:1 n=1 Tax=Funneliformis caledonium TaxID=1117310 RepID=A0A9N9N392_9GLOM|nr:8236_t:CDS:2 [Funneliformis caledonium]